MKSKKSIYFLLPLVLLIWGVIAYQFFSFAKTDSSPTRNNSEFILKPLEVKPRDTVAINVKYRDPFLGKMYTENNNSVQPKRFIKSTAKPIVNTTLIVLQTILYKGIVSDTKDKTKIFMLIINGHTYLMKKGDLESDVLLKEGNRESITVKNKGTLQTIPLQV